MIITIIIRQIINKINAFGEDFELGKPAYLHSQEANKPALN